MKKLIIVVALMVTLSVAKSAEIAFLDNPEWKTVLEKAKKEQKMIFFDAYATWCGPCKNMDATTYKDQAVADFYNSNFINVKYDMEKGEGPMLAERYFVTAYPSLLFLNSEGVMAHKGLGFIEAAAFVTLGETAKNPDKQYYTLKRKALTLNHTQFLAFAQLAATNDDEEFDGIIKDYLTKQADILGTKELIDLLMKHARLLPAEKDIVYVVNNKDKIVATGNYTIDEVEKRIADLTLMYSLSPTLQPNEEIDFNITKSLLEKYVPTQSFYVYHFFRVYHFLGQKKLDEAVKEFNTLLENTPAKVSFNQIFNSIINLAPTLAKEGKLDVVLSKFDAIKSQPAEAYMKDYAKAIIYYKLQDAKNFKAIANALIAGRDTPENVKEELKKGIESIPAGQ